ncbi:hypothetical protein C8F04DRAFT_1116460 [Mycena alexandri]|uniref:Uncharacterized protein n=1 Tax=Mycena alexandri TaxID=1745969 RepID=A0AAD6SKS8_9AGAR|nr:hypothetical protein C8F04DRAFT_1116460 [Mycena alexandri]
MIFLAYTALFNCSQLSSTTGTSGPRVSESTLTIYQHIPHTRLGIGEERQFLSVSIVDPWRCTYRILKNVTKRMWMWVRVA